MRGFVIRLKNKDRLRHIALAILSFIGTGGILFLTNINGAGLTPDSVAYISAARNLADGFGLLTYNGLYLVVQPPLYPIILSVIKKILLTDPLISASYLNALIFGLIVYLSGLLLLRYLNSFVLSLLGTISVLISYALVQASVMALSELLFIFLVLLFLYYFGEYQKKHDVFSFYVFSISAALSCLTRYTGVIIILTGLICIFLWSQNNSKEKLRRSIVFLLITILPITIWIMRNYYVSGTLVGVRASSSYTITDNIGFFYNTVLRWYLPLSYTGIYFVFIVSLITGWVFFGEDRIKSSITDSLIQIGPSLLFVIFYAGVIIVSSTTTAYDRISDRLLSPMYIPIILISFFILDKILSRLIKYSRPKLITALFAVCIILMMRYPATNTINILEEYNVLSGLGYNCAIWKESETIKYLNKHEQLGKKYSIYSNEPEAVYILTNLKSERSPAKTFYNSRKLFNLDLKKKELWKNKNNVCLVWFDKTNRNFLFTIDELRNKINMTELARLKDGEIYTFSMR